MRPMSDLTCAICRKLIERRPANRFYPFCSERCRMVDLGKWMGEEYKVPAAPDELDEFSDELHDPNEDEGD
jgi:endogenous inhibitor of DNA gyrase (YacG/DUF329 family)